MAERFGVDSRPSQAPAAGAEISVRLFSKPALLQSRGSWRPNTTVTVPGPGQAVMEALDGGFRRFSHAGRRDWRARPRRDCAGPSDARSAVNLDDARPSGAARCPIACRALTLTLTLASVISAGAVRTHEAPVHNA